MKTQGQQENKEQKSADHMLSSLSEFSHFQIPGDIQGIDTKFQLSVPEKYQYNKATTKVTILVCIAVVFYFFQIHIQIVSQKCLFLKDQYIVSEYMTLISSAL